MGRVLSKNDQVIFESTVYPGVTEEVCAPLLEKESGLKAFSDFKLGYSPERMNPGDKLHGLKKISKVVAGQDKEHTTELANIYGSIIDAPIHQAESIKVAEAAKVIENIQRDVNIALINEFSLIFDRLEINTKDVLKAAETKWNFLPFKPGLVGGHCIGVDPYYLTYRAQVAGYIPEVILSGRRINDYMGTHIAQKTIKLMSANGINTSNAKVALLGLTFKENCSDTRNSRSFDIAKELEEYNVNLILNDPLVKTEEIQSLNKSITDLENIKDCDAIVLSVAHDQYKDVDLNALVRKGGVIVDVKSLYNANNFPEHKYWSL